MTADEATRNAAVTWAARTRDPEFDDWLAFTAWLEEDRKNSSAYDEVIFVTDDAAKLMADDLTAPRFEAVTVNEVPVASNDEGDGADWFFNRRWFGGAIAASLVGVLAFGLTVPEPSLARYGTSPGETLAIDLEDGAKIQLGGGSEITLSGADRRLATLINGQATFSVEPGDHAPFKVIAGSDTIVDMGTVFDVRLDGTQLQVEVSEGAVVVNPDTRNLRLNPGQSLTKQGQVYSIGEVDLESVGEWRAGRVTFRSATIDDVATRLTRSTGVVFLARDPNEATFSGSVLVDPIKADPASVGSLLDVEVQQTESGWALSTR